MRKAHSRTIENSFEPDKQQISQEEIWRLYKTSIEMERSFTEKRTLELALIEATVSGDIFSISSLLERGSDVDIKDNANRTLLSRAAENGHEAVARLLLERGGDLHSKDSDGRTPLFWAAWNGHEAVVRLLLARDDVAADSKDSDGRTPLSWAAQYGHEAVVRLLTPDS